MTRIHWRWEDQDFGFRFRVGMGKSSTEYYQAERPGEYYVVTPDQRKLDVNRIRELSKLQIPPVSPAVVAIPWRNYHLDWDSIETANGICLNYAGCLHRAEIERREDEGVARAMEFVASLAERTDPVTITVAMIQQVHKELLGAIYPFAGRWRCVELHKGEGPVKWPMPRLGLDAAIQKFEKDILGRTPLVSDDDAAVFSFISELMNEFLVIHPFREGNGRTAFILGNLVLMQNDLLPLDVYDQARHQSDYYAACEAGRLHGNYGPLAELISQWEEEAVARWEEANG